MNSECAMILPVDSKQYIAGYKFFKKHCLFSVPLLPIIELTRSTVYITTAEIGVYIMFYSLFYDNRPKLTFNLV